MKNENVNSMPSAEIILITRRTTLASLGMTLQQADRQRRVRRLGQLAIRAQETFPRDLAARGVAFVVHLHGEGVAHLTPDEARQVAEPDRLVASSDGRHRGTHEDRKIEQGPASRAVASDRQQVATARG
jgi:hypothetical protein